MSFHHIVSMILFQFNTEQIVKKPHFNATIAGTEGHKCLTGNCTSLAPFFVIVVGCFGFFFLQKMFKWLYTILVSSPPPPTAKNFRFFSGRGRRGDHILRAFWTTKGDTSIQELKRPPPHTPYLSAKIGGSFVRAFERQQKKGDTLIHEL